MPIQAIIEIKAGEKQYKCMNSEWLVDGDGPIMFRMLSKLRVDGQVEAVMTTSAVCRPVDSASSGNTVA